MSRKIVSIVDITYRAETEKNMPHFHIPQHPSSPPPLPKKPPPDVIKYRLSQGTFDAPQPYTRKIHLAHGPVPFGKNVKCVSLKLKKDHEPDMDQSYEDRKQQPRVTFPMSIIPEVIPSRNETFDSGVIPRYSTTSVANYNYDGDVLPDRSIFTVERPVFGPTKKSVKLSEHDSSQVVMTYHQRRRSSAFMQNTSFPRKSSFISTFLGSGHRRFSEDIRKEFKFPDGTSFTEQHVDTTKVLFFQVFIPFLIAGFGNVGAGVLLDHVQHWTVFKEIPELFLLVASFLGFKGNLEMSLAARLATQANLGQLDRPSAQVKVCFGNVALIQAQAIVVAFLAAMIAICVNWFRRYDFDVPDSMLLLSTSIVTASATGLVMAVLMVCVTVFARGIGANPDNVSTLTAACLGDVLAVVLLSYSAKLFHSYRYLATLQPSLIFVYCIILLPVFLFIAYQNCYTKEVAGKGWYPIIIAMVISSAGGLIFDFAVEFFETIAIFEPIINGVGSNLVAVQASRISTYFHQRSVPGNMPEELDDGICVTPGKAFFGKSEYLNVIHNNSRNLFRCPKVPMQEPLDSCCASRFPDTSSTS